MKKVNIEAKLSNRGSPKNSSFIAKSPVKSNIKASPLPPRSSKVPETRKQGLPPKNLLI